MAYKLSSVLFGHSLDVRSLATTEDGKIISTSRDKTAKVWTPNGLNSGYNEAATLRGHTSFVSCVCVLSPFPQYPNGLILTGGCDKKICAFHPTLFQPLFILDDHKDNVCSLSAGIQPGFVLSSSWDKSAKLWRVGEQECVLTLTGHELTIWRVLQMANGTIVTGSADKTIRVYSPDGTYLRTLTGHKDCVRDLAAESAVELLSCANDATIRKWNVDTGESLEVYFGHKHYIYSLVASGGLMVSGGEDRAVRVWIGKESEEIALPVQSVWAVARLPNGDIVTGTNDGVVRVFSSDPDRQADQATLASFQDDIANFGKADEQEIGGVKVSDLPGPEALYEPGRADGQTKMVREGAKVVCYSWSAANGEWNKIGDVMGAQAAPGKTIYNGKEYDFVFSVDIEDGKPPLKLPYNRGDDPWLAAQEFIHRNFLSQQFLEQVANFIITNSKDDTSTPPVTGAVDPFTGGARYIPGGGAGGGAGVTGTDPFTGGTRYVPGSGPPTQGSGMSTTDPFTGGTRYVPNGTPAASPSNLFPQTSYLRFDQGNLQPIQDKLIELNQRQPDIVSQDDLQAVVKLGNLGAAADSAALATLRRLLNWPPEVVFPVLDVTRLALRNSAINDSLCAEPHGPELMSVLENHLSSTGLPTNQMLALRVTCNMMSHPRGEALVISKRHFLLAAVRQLATSKANKTLQIALATLLLNLSVAVLRVNDVPCQHEVVASLSLVLPWLPEPEAVLRGLVALGTLLEHSGSLHAEVSPETLERLRTSQTAASDPTQAKVANCARQILNLLKLQEYSEFVKIAKYLFAIPAHNANTERIFSFMNIQWTDERNRMEVDSLEAILQILYNYKMDCVEFYNHVLKNKEMIRKAGSSEKYPFLQGQSTPSTSSVE